MTRPRARRELAAAAALLAVAVCALLPGPILAGQTLFRRDMNMIWLPQAESFVRLAAQGSTPLWDPWRAFGLPLLADPRAEIAYPPTWLNLVLGPATYYTCFVAGHLLLAGLGMYRLARRRLPALAAATAALAWTASGPLVSLGSVWHHLAGAAWIPWVVLGCERCFDGPRARMAPLALAFGAQIVSGSPDANAATLLTCLPFVLGAARASAAPRTGLLRVAGGLAGAAALSAVQWMPTLALLAGTERVRSGAGASVWPLSPAQLVEVVLPVWWNGLPLQPWARTAVLGDREPFLLSVYLGAPVLALALLGAARRDRWRWPLVAVASVSVAAAVGRHFLVYPALVTVLPPLGMLRFPVKAMVPAAFAVALLAGLGAAALAAAVRAGRAKRVLVPLVVLLALVASAAVGLWLAGGPLLAPLLTAPPAESLARQLRPVAASMLALAALAVVVALAGRRRAARVAAAAALAATFELVARHTGVNAGTSRRLWDLKPEVLTHLDGAWPRVYVHDETIPTPDGRHDPSVYAAGLAVPGLPPAAVQVAGVHLALQPPTAARWGVAGSYDADTLGLYDRRLALLTDAIHRLEHDPARHLRMLQVGAVPIVVTLGRPGWTTSLRERAVLSPVLARPVHVFSVPDPLPRAYFVSGVRVAADPEVALRMLQDPAFDPAGAVVLAAGTPRADGRGEARVVEHRGDRVTIDTSSAADGHVVLVETWDAGWRASVDGNPAPVVPANVAFRAVAVPAGRHRVELRYRPPAALAGAAVSAVALLGVIGTALRRRTA